MKDLSLLEIGEITGEDFLTVIHVRNGKSQERTVKIQDLVEALVKLLARGKPDDPTKSN